MPLAALLDQLVAFGEGNRDVVEAREHHRCAWRPDFFRRA